jgi:valyl-tRNA synthetase
MSKSLGNSPEPLELIDQYGADGVRVGLLLSAAAGNDLMFDEELCQQGRSFSNKIWNAFRLISGWEVSETIEQPEAARIGLEAYDTVFQKTLAEIESHFEKYRISDALMATYKLVWDEFCAWLLEIVKPAYGEPIDAKTYRAVISALENNLKILHPFMPFLSEEIWQNIETRTPEQALIIAQWSETKPFDSSVISDYEAMKEVVSGIRTIRAEKNIPFKEEVTLHIINNENLGKAYDTIVSKLTNTSNILYTDRQVSGALSFRVKSNEYFIPVSGSMNIQEEIDKLLAEKTYLEGFLKSVRAKLSNEKFVSGAPESVVANERQKEADALAKLETLEKGLSALKVG